MTLLGFAWRSKKKKIYTKTLIFESTTNAQDYNIDFYSNAGSVQGRINYAEGAGSVSSPEVASKNAGHF